MDKPTALQALIDVSAYVAPLPGSAAAALCLASVIGFIESQPEASPIMAPAAPQVTTPKKTTTPSSQIAFVSATRASPIRDIAVANALAAIVFKAPRDEPMLIEDIQVDSCREFIGASGGTPAVNNVTVRRCAARVGKRGIYIRYDSSNWLVEDVSFVARGVNNETGVIPMGVQLKDTAHDLIFRRGLCEGFQTDLTTRDPNSYWNADGFVAERGNYNILVEDWTCRNCTDGGFDFKATNMRLDRVLSEGCARNYRFWTNNHHGQVTSRNPVKRGGKGGLRHIGIYGGVTELTIDHLIVESDNDAPIFVNESSAASTTVILGKHDFRVPPTAPVMAGKALKLIDPQGNPIGGAT